MNVSSGDWLDAIEAPLRPALARAAAGAPASIALMQLLMECTETSQAEAALRTGAAGLERQGDHAGAARLSSVLDLLCAHPDALEIVRSVLSGLDHGQPAAGPEAALAYWADAFDRAARKNPVGSVALYSLGDAKILQAATDEIVAKLADWGLIAPGTECLDIGCGIGRFELALAGRVARIVGIDIAPAMVDAARQSCAGLANVEIRQVSGRDLCGFADQSFDLVLAADAFPYMVQASGELAATMIREAARVLRPGGRLAILNFSYRGDLEADRAEAERFAVVAGLRTIRAGTFDFSLWDAATFVLRRPIEREGNSGLRPNC